jgi:hypothetical protein
MNARDLGLAFGNGDTLVVHDNPNTISWWFYHYQASETIPENLPLKWFVSDVESEADL